MERTIIRTVNQIAFSLFMALLIAVSVPGAGYGQFKEGQKNTAIVEGQKADVKGVLLRRDGETFVLRDLGRTDTVVVLTDSTKIRTERKGIFRGHKPFDATALIPGLILEATGTGDAQGRLVAEDITFSEADLKAALTSYAQTAPLQKGLAETAKEVAETNERISNLDQYDVLGTVSVLFDVNKATLKPAAKAQLDKLAAKAPGAKNYLVEVKGHADATGDVQKNLDLSQRRCEAVVKYLAVKHNIPLRRMEMPMGYGETKAAGKTAKERSWDRRVDVTVMVNKGLNK
jgi:outer membrane protein OmpA-like peptidoglycan-associated protein